ncbi:MAG TPA: nuclear transport factor 2 family protein [Trebonia sp.]|jgi:hypothetical protein|nr:nuclear transport factor 2 family protein [Trebonia sp.]
MAAPQPAPVPATPATPLDLVRAHLAAEDAGDLDATMATFTQDCWYAIPAQDYHLRGYAAVRGHYERLLTTFPDLRNTEVELYDAGTHVFATMTVRRRHLGMWGPFPPTGAEVVTHALAVFPIAADGLLQAEIVHINPLEGLLQIGAVPTSDVLQLAGRYDALLRGQRPGARHEEQSTR